MADFIHRLRLAWLALTGRLYGSALRSVIVDAVCDDIAKGGRASRAIASAYGVSRRGYTNG